MFGNKSFSWQAIVDGQANPIFSGLQVVDVERTYTHPLHMLISPPLTSSIRFDLHIRSPVSCMPIDSCMGGKNVLTDGAMEK